MVTLSSPIAVFDSGVGGLSVLKEIRTQLPHEDVLYFADQGHVPYGPRPSEEIRRFTQEITRFLLAHDVKTVVVACNTASAVALHEMRHVFPDVPFVGMEPAVKPAANNSHKRVIGVIMTRTTAQGELYNSVVERFAKDVEVIPQVCPDFVRLVEAGELDSPATKAAAEEYLRPLLEGGIDHLVLGCTHFAFLIPILTKVLGPDIAIIDPAPAVARQTARVIASHKNPKRDPGETLFYTSGNPSSFRKLASRLLSETIPDSRVKQTVWEDHRVVESKAGSAFTNPA